MEQLACCRNQGLPVVALDMRALYENRDGNTALQKVVHFLQSGQSVVLTGAACRQDYEDFAAYGREKGISTDELAEFTKQTLSRMVPAFCRKPPLAVCF